MVNSRRQTTPVERWPSGLRRTLGKRVYFNEYRGFESHSLRHNLVLAKGKPRLVAESLIPPSKDELTRFGDRPIPALYQKNDRKRYDFIAHRCSMAAWVGMLTGQFGRPVIDKTGLTGKQ
jgi:uncharacterized protein (TIGR03435 family)